VRYCPLVVMTRDLGRGVNYLFVGLELLVVYLSGAPPDVGGDTVMVPPEVGEGLGEVSRVVGSAGGVGKAMLLMSGLCVLGGIGLCLCLTFSEAWAYAGEVTDPAIRPLLLPTIAEVAPYSERLPSDYVASQVMEVLNRSSERASNVMTPVSPMHMHGF